MKTAYSSNNTLLRLARKHPYLHSFSSDTEAQGLNAERYLPLHLLRMNIEKALKQTYLDKKWLSVAEVCQFLGISKSTFYKWRQIGEAPESRRLPNGDLRIREDWLVEFLMALPEGER